MGLFVTFAAAVIATASAIAAVLGGGGTTQLVVAFTLFLAGTAVVLGAVAAALDAG
jgi:hypothetical protein